MSYKIVDNFLTEEEHSIIQHHLLGNSFPWFFVPNVSYSNVTDDTFYFVHPFFESPMVRSQHFQVLFPILEKIKPNCLIRAKGNLYTKTHNVLENGKHVDYTFDHLGAVYYVNSNNGYTILEDGTRVNSIKNRMLFFDPSKPHQSTHCSDEKVRMTINFNYF